MAPPSADRIRERDQERLARDLAAMPYLAAGAEPAEEDLEVARKLLADHPAEVVAATLVRLQRAQLPAPEDLDETIQLHARQGDRPTRPPPPRMRSVWFRMNVGRDANADPKWLVPLICRRGRVDKSEIGAIHIEEGETHFEIAEHAADRFADSVRRPDRKDPRIRFQLVRR
jgi:ATP-dependent RNA helicase DeaD